jgi:NAD(P)-dependent dehydrogenase (short-subunit alcohol dehydrogenase family)
MKGKVVVVTGAGGRIGAACAREFAQRGASVIVADANGEAALATAESVTRSGGAAVAMEVNVALESDVRAMIERAVAEFGGVDILHNNAAATHESQLDDDLTTADAAVWDLTFAVNLRGPMLGCKYAIPHMIARGGGVIVNTSSGSGAIGEPTRFAYGASKAGVNSLTRSIAARYGKQNIRCVAVSPGITMPQEHQDAMAGMGWLAMMRRHHATPHLALPQDIARFVAFLASDEASFITGSVHPIDGGSSSAAPYAADMRDNGYGLF